MKTSFRRLKKTCGFSLRGDHGVTVSMFTRQAEGSRFDPWTVPAFSGEPLTTPTRRFSEYRLQRNQEKKYGGMNRSKYMLRKNINVYQ